ncbi:MAG: GntR family transcriptional regulator [Oscillospiraceae bacterium]
MININYRNPSPIYEQVKDSIRRLIITGVIAPGEKLTSVRELAAQLAINPNTIQRAYRELEAEGYIYSVPGKGSFAAERREIDGSRKQKLLKQFDDIALELIFLHVTVDELKSRLDSIKNNRN